MTEMRAQKKPNSNAGFSLVELLIAVTILSIIVIPLMHLFLSSAKLNVKSRQTLRATTVAQDIMEGLKAYDVDELQEQFNHPLDGFYVLDDRMVKGSIKEETDREEDSTGASIEGLYYFSMSDVTMQGTQYDALIKVDARGYMEGTADAALTSAPDLSALDPMDSAAHTTHNQEHNNKEMAKLGSVVEGKDGLYVQEKSEDDQVLDKIYAAFEDELEAGGCTREDLDFTENGFSVSGMSSDRWTIIKITDSGSTDEEGNPMLKAEVSILMQCTYKYEEKPVWIKRDIPVDNPNFTSGNFYVIFYPQYGMEEDVVIIDNQSTVPLKQVIVAKQVDETLTDAELYDAEEAYTAYLCFKGCDMDSLVIRTNLDSSLVNDTFLGAEPPADQEENNNNERVKVSFLTEYKENSSGIMERKGVTQSDLGKLKMYHLEGGRIGKEASIVPVQEDQTNVIYDVTVGIYKKGAAEEGFPKEDRVMLLSGSKND